MSGSSPWNTSAFASPPSTNTNDPIGMPSANAQAARDKTAQVMAAVKSGDMETAERLMGKDESGGKILPGVGWMKRRMNKKNKTGAGGKAQEVEHVEVFGSKDQDRVIR